MKIKRFVILLDVLFLIMIVYGVLHIQALTYETCDLPQVNDRYQFVIEQLDEGKDVETLESTYDCKIIFYGENDYSQSLALAIRNGDLILDYLNGETLIGKVMFERNQDSFILAKQKVIYTMLIVLIVCMTACNLLCLFLYMKVMKPFTSLKRFAGNIATGNLDIPLQMQKTNYFGVFTESFDVMREELKKAREGEAEANKSKKELVASLSHDIKTPVATIKALCEILEIKLNQNEPSYAKIVTIHQKADLINQLINNMFHATLEELHMLKVTPEELSSTILLTMFTNSDYQNNVTVKEAIPECLIMADEVRLNQVIDNIIGNSYKYANTPIDVSFAEEDGFLNITIQDHGENLSDTDMALVCEKFYRGQNAEKTDGSGLGLYLAKQFMEGMGGALVCEQDQGFVVILSLKKV